MKDKEKYTLEELCNELEIPISAFCEQAKITEGTLARLRKGYSARRSTINKMLKTFSRIYEKELSLDNVLGIYPIGTSPIAEKSVTPSIIVETVGIVPTIEDQQKNIAARNPGGAPKTEIPNDLPTGTIRLVDFIENTGLPESSISRYIHVGVKKGEKIETTTRTRTSGPGMQHFLTPAQQEKALDILSRHGKLKTSQPEQEEKPVAEEPPWWSPDGK